MTLEADQAVQEARFAGAVSGPTRSIKVTVPGPEFAGASRALGAGPPGPWGPGPHGLGAQGTSF